MDPSEGDSSKSAGSDHTRACATLDFATLPLCPRMKLIGHSLVSYVPSFLLAVDTDKYPTPVHGQVYHRYVNTDYRSRVSELFDLGAFNI
jgi:hypothetical protein